MGTFLKIWFPVSLAAHLGVLGVFNFVQLPTPKAEAQELTLVDIVEETPPPPVLPIKDEVTPPPPPRVQPPRHRTPPERPPLPDPRPVRPRVTPPTPRPGPVEVRPGVPHPHRPGGTGATEGNTMPGPGDRNTAPPDVMAAENGVNWAAPPGLPDGIGTQGTSGEGEPNGPSSPAAALGGPIPRYPKLALEEKLEGEVIVVVTVSPLGGPAKVVVEGEGSGYDVLDNAARRAAQSWKFTPAQEKGKPVKSTVRLRFRFINGKVEGSAL